MDSAPLFVDPPVHLADGVLTAESGSQNNAPSADKFSWPETCLRASLVGTEQSKLATTIQLKAFFLSEVGLRFIFGNLSCHRHFERERSLRRRERPDARSAAEQRGSKSFDARAQG